MATMKLVYSGTEIEFDPQDGYNRPDIMNRKTHRGVTGKIFTYNYSVKKRWEIPLAFISKADADNLNSWWENNYNLTFYADLINLAGTSYTVKMTNKERPLPTFGIPHWEDKFSGTLILEISN